MLHGPHRSSRAYSLSGSASTFLNGTSDAQGGAAAAGTAAAAASTKIASLRLALCHEARSMSDSFAVNVPRTVAETVSRGQSDRRGGRYRGLAERLVAEFAR